jgi:hypothetical protein
MWSSWITGTLALGLMGGLMGVGAAQEQKKELDARKAAERATVEARGGLLPDLIPLEEHLEDYELQAADDRVLLRFPTAIANVGDGPIEIFGERREDQVDRMHASQVFYDGKKERVAELPIGEFEYHEEHDHWHLLNVAVYRLRDKQGKVVAASEKVSFCLFDDTLIRPDLKDAPRRPKYAFCPSNRALRTIRAGVSVGWADIYGKHLEGQWIDVTDIPPGEYRLEVEVDPDSHLIEKTRKNNIASVPVRIEKVDAARKKPPAADPHDHPDHE